MTKLLGVIIDDKLNWKDTVKSLKKTTAMICKVSHVLNNKAHCVLCCSLAPPYMMCCADVWGNTYGTNVVRLFIKQNS